MRQSLSAIALIAASFAQEQPTAEQILDRYVEVTGGRKAHEAIRTEVMRSIAEVKAQGITGPTESYRDGKNYYLVMDIKGAGKVEEGAYNGIIWQNSALMGPRIRTGEEKAFFEREAVLDKHLNWRSIYSKAELAGEELVGDRPCHKVVLTPNKGGNPETRYYDKTTSLLSKVSLITPSPMGDIPADQLFLEYKEFSGVKVPTRSITKMAQLEMSMTVTSMEFNKAIPASRFTPPPEILALAKQQAKN